MGMEPRNIAIIGANGAIGSAFERVLSIRYPTARHWAFSRQGVHRIDYRSEESIAAAADLAARTDPLDLVITAIGVLHDGDVLPEKSLKDLSVRNFRHLFDANTIAPALIAKQFLPKLNRQQPSRFAALSARVGSISDNGLGGWYAYRASKAALNMCIKTFAIETARRNDKAIIVGLHPGTVDSDLSRPFQRNVPEGKLFSPDHSATMMLDVLLNLTAQDSGKCFAWDGQEIPP